MNAPGTVCARCAKIVSAPSSLCFNTNPNRSSAATAVFPVPAVPVGCIRNPTPVHIANWILGLGHTCEAQMRASEAQTHANANAQTQARRPRASRSRAGCLSCRERKKKCDETHPRCSDCRRLNLPCRWWSRSPISGSGSVSELDRQSPSQGVPLSDTATAAPSTSPPREGWIAPSDQRASSSPSGSASVSAAGHGTFGSDIDWPAQMEMVVTPVASPGGDMPYLDNEEDRSLFNHYLHTVARALSRAANTDSAGNPFLTTLVPMAAASDTLTSVLLGLSGCHWRRVYPGIWKRALARQGRGL